MSKKLVTVTQGADILEIVGKMADRGVQRVIVVDGRVPVGILSRRDVLRAIIASKAKKQPTEADDQINRALLSELSAQAWFDESRMHVAVANGIVTLKRAVFSEEERSALRLAAESRKNVRGVNDITVSEFN